MRVILAAATGLAVAEMCSLLGPEEAARELRTAADICQRAADRGEVVGALAVAEAMGRA